MKKLIITAVLLVSSALFASAEKPANKAKFESEILSVHETTASFEGLNYHQCRGRTLRCPKKCGHSGEFATFKILSYTKYEKKGEYGDPKQEEFKIQVSDFDKNPLKSDDPVKLALLEKIRAMKVGDKLVLNWNHIYTTRKENGGSASYPERIIQKIEPLTAKKKATQK